MTNRTRVRTLPFAPQGGTCKWFYAPAGFNIVDLVDNSSGLYLQSQQCIDEVGSPGADHTLVIDKYEWAQVGVVNGKHLDGGGSFREYSNWVSPLTKGNLGHLSTPGLMSVPDAANKLLARTNPSRADIQTLVFVAELRDAPQLVKLAGDTILKRGAGAYLSWEFGWAPLIDDIKKMLDFRSRVDKRVRELHQLYGKGGLRRRMTLDRATAESSSTITVESNLSGFIKARKAHFTNVRRWGTVRYLPTSLPPKDESDYHKLAARLVYGLTPSMSSLWNALPWTWLSDWFIGIGDYIDATDNTVPTLRESCCIMTEYTSSVRFDPVTPLPFSEWSYGPSTFTCVTKVRNPGQGASVTVNVPFLSAHQLSILGALFINKHRAH
jgi:hypothetical protein